MSRGHPVYLSFPLVWMSPYPLPLLRFLLVASTVLADNWTDSFVAPVIPLVIKSPYPQIWLLRGVLEDPVLNHALVIWNGSPVRSRLNPSSCHQRLTCKRSG